MTVEISSAFSVVLNAADGSTHIIDGLEPLSSLHDLVAKAAVAFGKSVYHSTVSLGSQILVLNQGPKTLTEVGICEGSELTFIAQTVAKWVPARLKIVRFGDDSNPGAYCSREGVSVFWAALEGVYHHDPVKTNPHVFIGKPNSDAGLSMLYWCFDDRGQTFWRNISASGKCKKRFADPTFSGFGAGCLNWPPPKGVLSKYDAAYIIRMRGETEIDCSWGFQFRFEGLSTEIYGNDDFLAARETQGRPAEEVEFDCSDDEYGVLELSDEDWEKYKAADATARREMICNC